MDCHLPGRMVNLPLIAKYATEILVNLDLQVWGPCGSSST